MSTKIQSQHKKTLKVHYFNLKKVFLQSYVIMAGGCLPETENKRLYQISGPKSGCCCFGDLGSSRLRESFWNSVWLRNKRIICKVVTYGRWLLMRSGPYERVDRIPLKAFTQASRSLTGETALVSFCQDKFKQHIYYLSLPEFPLPYPLSLDGSTEKWWCYTQIFSHRHQLGFQYYFYSNWRLC